MVGWTAPNSTVIGTCSHLTRSEAPPLGSVRRLDIRTGPLWGAGSFCAQEGSLRSAPTISSDCSCPRPRPSW